MKTRTIVDNINRRLAITGLSAAEASRRAELSPDGIRNWQRAADDGREVRFSHKSLAAVADVLGTTVDALQDPAAATEATIIGFAEPNVDDSGLAHRRAILSQLPPYQNAKAPETAPLNFELWTNGTQVRVSAAIDKKELDDLIERLQALKRILGE